MFQTYASCIAGKRMEGFVLIGQGAEARLYRGTYLGKPTLLKERFEKKYRHSELDARLTKDRIRAEARAIVRAKSAGVRTPALFLVDLERRSIFMEYIENAQTLKNFIEDKVLTGTDQAWINGLAQKIARLLGKLHSKNIIHGDLTTSNMLISQCTDEQAMDRDDEEQRGPLLILIDFGLARVESTIEDKAVDLYVLERSLLSSHSELPTLFPAIVASYADAIRHKSQCQEIMTKYKEVRARGRKRLMIG